MEPMRGDQVEAVNNSFKTALTFIKETIIDQHKLGLHELLLIEYGYFL